MHVVEHEHEWPCLRARAQEAARGVEEAKARTLRLGTRRLRQVGKELAKLGKELGEVRRPGAELGSQPVGLGVADVGAQRLNPGPVGGRAAGLPATADEDTCPASAGMCDQLVRKSALADAGLSGEQEQAPAAGERVIETGDELVQLGVTADKRAARGLRGGPASADPSTAASWSSGSCARIARSSSRSRSPGSIPSSSTSLPRASWYAWRASA